MKKKKTLFKKTGGDVKWPVSNFSEGGNESSAPCAPGLIFLKSENKCVSATYYALKNKDLSVSTVKDHLEANDNFSNAVTWMKNWQESPKYKKMLYNSTVVKNNGDKTEYNKINEQRNSNLLTIPPVEIKKEPLKKNKKLDKTSALSWDDDGRVEIFPMGLKLKTLPVHEVTHSVHRTNNPPVSKNDMTMTSVYVDKKTGKETIVTDDNLKKNYVNKEIAIPVSNQKYINEHKANNFFQSQEYINNKEKYDAFKKNPNKKNKDGLSFKDFLENYKEKADYVGTSTETIGRLNAIRERSQKEKLYDPFTEEVSPELFKNTLKDYKFEEDELWDPMYQLKSTFSDEEIIWMLNNISKNEVEKEQIGVEGKAKNGGSIKWPANTKMNNGGFTNKFAESGNPCDTGYYWNGTKCVKAVSKQPTYEDSLFLYNNSQDLDKWMKQNKYYWKDLTKYNSNRWSDRRTSYDYLKNAHEAEIKSQSRTKPFSSYVKKIGNLIGTSDWIQGGYDDYGLPFTWRHPNINPQEEGDMIPIGRGNDPFSYSFRYEPIAIKPSKLLTDAEIVKRYKKYGESGIEESRLKKLGLVDDKKSEPIKNNIVKKDIKLEKKEEPIKEKFIENLAIENLPFLKPSLIQQQNYQLQGADEYNEALENLEAPSYEPLSSYNEYFGKTGRKNISLDRFIGGTQYGRGFTVPTYGMIEDKIWDPKTSQWVNKQFRKDRKIQKESGYDRSYYEGGYDEEGNYIPGEIENAERENRRVNFDHGQMGKKDRKAQEHYNLEYDEYEFRKKFPTLLDELNITYEDYINQNVPKKQYGGSIKWPTSVKMADGGEPCPNGYVIDPITGDCIISLASNPDHPINFYEFESLSPEEKAYRESLALEKVRLLEQETAEKNRLSINDYTYPENTEAALAWETEKQQFPLAAHDADEWYENWYNARMTKPEFAEIAKKRHDATVNRKTPYILEAMEEFRANGHGNSLAVTYVPKVSDPKNKPFENKIFIQSAFGADEGYNDYYNTFFQNPEYAKGYLFDEILHEKSHWDENNFRQPGTSRLNIKDDEILNKLLPKEYLVPGKNIMHDPETGEYDFDYTTNLNKEWLETIGTPTEVRARLNRWRQYNNIDPLKDYTPSEIQEIINKNTNDFKNSNGIRVKDPNILQLYKFIHADPNILKTLNDKYVSNDSNKNLDTAKQGGSITCSDDEYWDGENCVPKEKDSSPIMQNPSWQQEPVVNSAAYVSGYRGGNPKMYKYGFLNSDQGNIVGGGGFGFPKPGVHLSALGVVPTSSNDRQYFKGAYEANISKDFTKNLNLGLGVKTAITGYPGENGFVRDPIKLQPNLNLRFNFKEGGMFKKLGADVKWPTLENYDDGGIYTFPGRPGSYYKQQSDGTYLIKNNKTNGQYIKMNDPDGTRTKTLNAGRVAYKKPVQTQITPGNTQVSESTSVNNIYQKPLSTINYNPNVNALTNQTIPLSNTKPQVVKPKSVVATNFNINTTDQVKKANAITKEKEIQETILANERLSKNALPEKEKTQAEFEADQWKKYDKLDWASKLLDRGKAFGVDPLGMATRVLTGDQGYIPGMGDGIFSEDENERKKFLTSMNYTPGKFEASDVQNILNPFYWGASAGSKIGDGLFNSTDEYGNHKIDLIKTGTGVVEGGLAMFGANKAPQAVNQFTGKVAPKVQKVSDIITKAGKNYDLFRKTPLAEMVGQGWNEIAWNGSKKLGTSNFAAGRVFGNLPNNIASNSFRNISPYLNLSNAAKVYAGYKAGKGVMDGTTLHKNQQVYEDIKNGDFNAGNLYDAASADLKLASAFAAPFTHALDFKVIKGVDKLAHYGAATTNPFNYDSYAKGFFKLNENLNKKNGGIITNNILIKYPQMYSANKKLDQFFNGGTI